MDMLHGLVATGLSEELARAVTAAGLPTNSEGYAPISPQLIDKALKFLKDNGIDAPQGNAKVDHLASELRDLDLDDVSLDMRH